MTSMSEKLLRTKLYVPPRRPNLISRPRLIERLNLGLQLGHKIALISAPAGFGKSTLISEWESSLRADIATQGDNRTQLAWLSLDQNDNDLTRFLTYIIGSLNQIEGINSPIGRGAQGMLQSPQPPASEDILISLINDLTTLPYKIILVLDDYHLLTSAAVDEALTFLLAHLPTQMFLVLVTREDPAFSLARFRAGNQLTELRATDLRFSSDEAAKFLNQVMGLALTPDDVQALESRTEGWVAGLQLAAISLQRHPDASSFIKSFTGSHHFVLDYLVEEVLEQQPESIQLFLLQTAVLDKLNASLCDALTGQSNGQETLQLLEHNNLFIIPLDENRRWYRYYHLFADLLRQHLRQEQPERLGQLHCRASEWYEQNRFTDEAIEHALLAEDFERTIRLIDEQIDFIWSRGEHRKLQRWLNVLPEDVLFTRPMVCIHQARFQCNSGKLDAAEQTLRAVEEALDTGSDLAGETGPAHPNQAILHGRAAATRALICSYQGDVPGIVQNAERALAYLPREDSSWHSVTALILGNAHGFKGDMTAAYKARMEALQACQAAGNIFFIILANLELAITLRELGRLQQTIEICREQFQVANQNDLSQTRIIGWLLAVWGEALAELDNLDEAVTRGKQGFEMTRPDGDLQFIGWTFMCLIRILYSRGDLAGAEALLQTMEKIARQSTLPPWIKNQVAAWQVRIWLAQDNLQAAFHWAVERGLYAGGKPVLTADVDFFLLFDYIVLARILIARGQLENSISLLKHLLSAAETGGRTAKVIEIQLLQSIAFQANGDDDQAIATFKQALALAEPEGFVRIFVDEGPPLAHLLDNALARGLAPSYVRRLRAAFASEEGASAGLTAPLSDQTALVEPLSEREIEVLQLIAEGLTNPEIAAQLYLSLNTVKVHTRNIYGKLDAHNRTQAVARARALEILPA